MAAEVRQPKRAVPSMRRGPLPADSVVARLADLSLPHVESFSYFVDHGLAQSVAALSPREYKTTTGQM